MRIKKFVHLLILLPFFMGIIVIGLLQIVSYSEYKKRNEIEIAQDITAESFNLSRLSRDITLHPNEQRAPRQWRESYQRLTDLIPQINDQKYADRLELIQHERQKLDTVFSRLLDAATTVAPNVETQQFRLNRIENQMTLHTYALSLEAMQLMSEARQDLASERKQSNQLITALIALLIVLITMALKRWARNTLQRIENLRQVAEIISTGDFKHLIGDKELDELGDFSRAMDSMVQKLKQIEHHVSERTNELKSVNERLNEVLFALNRSGVGVEIIDVESGQFEYVNMCTCEMLGYSESELLAMTISEVDPHVRTNRLQSMAHSVLEKGLGHFESEHLTHDGRKIPVEVTVYYQAPELNRDARYIAFVTDISERKAFQDDLLKTKIAAENANHAKSVFLANMSHELRTPLNAILGFAQLMARNDSVPDAVQSDVQTIIRSGQQLLSLINDVLEISSIETGHLRVKLETIHLPNLLSTLADSVQLPNRKVLFQFEPAPDLPEYIHSDFGKLRRIIQNLLMNAIKFTSRGTITLQVYTQLQDEQWMLCIVVRDTGVGIATSEMDLLFKPFFQSDYGMNLGTGTGLGLYIAQEYANILGGKITVESMPDKGSKFLITLPITLATENEPVVNHKGDILNLAAGQTTFRILVVDDQPENQHLISELLKQVGFQVCVAANGQQAVQCFQKWKPHFIYMDVRMPEMNGSEATRIIRAMSGGKGIPIIALTASVLDSDHPDILEAGCNAVLKKPVEPNVLFETIGRYLNVEFEYGSQQKVTKKDLKPLNLSVLPHEIRQRLYAAAISLDAEVISMIVAELMPDYREIALHLQQLADEFQFDFISTLAAQN